jgi:4'-phosphopantetheinyl transferase
MITSYFTDIGARPNDEMYTRVSAKVNGLLTKDISRMAFGGRYMRLIGDLLLYKLLCDHNLENTLLIDAVKVNKWGKPYFANTDFEYNISHSGSTICCVGCRGAQLGVDIEMENDRDIDGLRDYFNQREWNKIKISDSLNAEFYRMWVRKEACIKAIGKGLIQPLNEIDVCDDEVVSEGIRWFLQDVFIRDGYKGCIAANKKMDVRIEPVDLDKLVT